MFGSITSAWILGTAAMMPKVSYSSAAWAICASVRMSGRVTDFMDGASVEESGCLFMVTVALRRISRRRYRYATCYTLGGQSSHIGSVGYLPCRGPHQELPSDTSPLCSPKHACRRRPVHWFGHKR